MNEIKTENSREEMRSKNEEDFKILIKMIEEDSVSIDFNGHFQCETDKRLFHAVNYKKNQYKTFEHMAEMDLGTCCWFPEELDKIYECMKKGEVAEIPFRFNVNHYNQCGVCGESLKFEFDGKVIRVINKCESPEGYFPMKNTLDFPSGKVVVCNDMRVLWPDVETIMEPDRFTKYGLSSSLGFLNTVNIYMEHNMAHVFVGNTMPDVNVDNGNTIIVGKMGYADEAEDEIQLPGINVANVCTDLWWYCMADYEETERRFNKYKDDITNRWGKDSVASFDEFLKDRSCDVFEVDPGTYEFEVYEHPSDMVSYQNELEYDGQPIIYSVAKKV